jgi:hypothetical protein
VITAKVFITEFVFCGTLAVPLAPALVQNRMESFASVGGIFIEWDWLTVVVHRIFLSLSQSTA